MPQAKADVRSPLRVLQTELAAGRTTALDVARETAGRANGNASRNTYLDFDERELYRRAEWLQDREARSMALYGVPISLKDCFDVAGKVTTCGSGFYARHNGVAEHDSAIAQRLRESGALITGKTHLHPLAYGITGQNPDYGDCLQPRDASLLTGGSSSGAAASVQEGSALAAVGTDTGGSIRVPAALCGLAGYRASRGLSDASGWFPRVWEGGAHLAPSFDTVGFLARDARDLAPIAKAVLGVPPGTLPAKLRIGCVGGAFLHDAESEVLETYLSWQRRLEARGIEVGEFDGSGWGDSLEIFAGTQAHEAAAIHAGHYEEFEPSIRERLRWGASLTEREVTALKKRGQGFGGRMNELLASFDLLMLPAAPIGGLRADADLSGARSRILRYTTPFSLAGLPAVTLPGRRPGTGVQIAAAASADPMLLAFAASCGGEAEWDVRGS